MDQNPTSTPPTGKNFDVTKAMLDGKNSNDIISFVRANKLTPQFDDPETFQKKYPDLPYIAYQQLKDTFHTEVTAGIVDKQMANPINPFNLLGELGAYKKTPTSFNVEQGFDTFEPPKYQDYNALPMNLPTPGGFGIDVNTADASANANDWFVDKNGRVLSTKFMDKLTTNPVQFEMSPDGNSAYWKEIGDEQFADPTRIKSDAFGPRQLMTDNLLGSFGRGLWSGSLPMLAKGVGAMAGWGNALYSDIVNFDDFIDGSKSVTPEKTWAYSLNRTLSNWGSGATKTNIDEQQELFSNMANTLYQLGNGISQVVGTMAPSFGASFAAAKLFGASAERAAVIGEWAGILTGGAESGGMVADQMRSLGYSEQEIQRVTAWYGVATIISERIPWMNLTGKAAARAGARAGGAVRAKTIADAVPSPVGAIMGAETVEGKGLKAILQNAWNKAKSPEFASKFKEVAIAGGAEALEEFPIESSLQGIVSMVKNGVDQMRASETKKMMSGWTFSQNAGADSYLKPITITDVNGSTKNVSESEAAAYKMDAQWADDILSGKIEMSTGGDWREGAIAALATWSTMGMFHGAGAILQRKNVQDAQHKLASIGVNIALGNESMESVLKAIDVLDEKHGYFGSREVDHQGKLIASGQKDVVTQADFYKNTAIENITYYAELAKRRGITEPAALVAINVSPTKLENRDLLAKAVVVAASIDLLEGKLASQQENTPITFTEDELIKNDLYQLLDPATRKPKQVTPEEIQNLIQKKQQELALYIAPKMDVVEGKPAPMQFIGRDGQPRESKYSPKYSEKFLESDHKLDEIEADINDEVIKKIGKKEDAKNQKKWEEKYQKEKNKLTREWYSRGRMKDVGDGKKKFFSRQMTYNTTDPSFINFFTHYRDLVMARTQSYVAEQNAAITNYNHPTEDQFIQKVGQARQVGTDIANAFDELNNTNFENFDWGTISKQEIDKSYEGLNKKMDEMVSDIQNQQDETKRGKMTTTFLELQKELDAEFQKKIPAPAGTIKEKIKEAGEKTNETWEEASMKSTGKLLDNLMSTKTHDFTPKVPITVADLTEADRLNILTTLLDTMRSDDDAYSFKQIVEELKKVADNPAGNIEQVELAGEVLSMLELTYGNRMKKWLTDNVDFLQKKIENSDDTYEHSLLVKFPDARVSQTNKDAYDEWYKELKRTTIDPIRGKINASLANQKVSLLRATINRLEIANLAMQSWAVKFASQLDKDTIKLLDDAKNRMQFIIDQKYNGKEIKRLYDLIDIYINLDNTDTSTAGARQAIEDRIAEFDAIIVQTADKLSGKMGAVTDEILRVIDREVLNLDAFENKVAIKTNESQGLLSAESFKTGEKVFDKIRNLEPSNRLPAIEGDRETQYEAKFFLEFMLFFTHRINMAGQNNAPKYSELYQIIRDNVNATFGSNGEPLVDENGIPKNVSPQLGTSEQFDIITHLLGWYYNPDQEYLKKFLTETTQLGKIWDKTILLRAYNGTGKSTFIFRNFIEGLLRRDGITTEAFTVTVITANKGLEKTFDANKKMLQQQYPGFEINILHADEVIKTDKLIPSGTNLVWIEEASLFSVANTKALQDHTSGFQRVIVGDDGQTTANKVSPAWWEMASISEKTTPATESFRSNNIVSFNNLFAWSRQQFFSATNDEVDWSSMTGGKWKVGLDGAGPIGLKVNRSREEVLHDFKVFTGILKGPDGNHSALQSQAILVVANTLEKEMLLRGDGKDIKAAGLSHLVKTIQYDIDAIISGKGSREDNISGIESDYVFIYNDWQSLATATNKVAIDTATELGLAVTDPYKQTFEIGRSQARHILTSASRAKRYLSIVNPEAAMTTEALDKQLPDNKIDGWGGAKSAFEKSQVLFTQKILNRITGGQTTYQTAVSSEDLIYNAILTPEEQKIIAEKPEIETFKKKFNDEFPTGNRHVTSLETVEAFLPDGKKEEIQHDIDLAATKLHREILMLMMNPKRKQSAALDYAEKLLKAYLKTGTITEYTAADIPSMLQKTVDLWLGQLYLAPGIAGLVGNPLAIVGQHMTSDDISGQPMIIKIVGFDTVLNKPIVDIIDFTFAKVDKASEYTNAKLGTYAALAIANGAIVNKIEVIPVTLTRSNKFLTSNWGNSFFIPSADKMKWTKFGIEQVGSKAPTSSYFASIAQMKMNARTLPFDYEGLRVQGYYLNKKTGDTEMITGMETNSQGKFMVHTIQPNNNVEVTYSLDDFKTNFSFTSMHYSTVLFRSTAKAFYGGNNVEGIVVGTSHVFPVWDLGADSKFFKGNFYKVDSAAAEDDFGGQLVKMRSLVRQKLVGRGKLTKKLYAKTDPDPIRLMTVSNYGDTKEEFTSWHYIVLNELDDLQIRAVLKSSLELQKLIDKIEDADIGGIPNTDIFGRFRKLGLHVISTDHQPEYDYKDPKGLQISPILEKNNNEFFAEAVDYIENGNEKIFSSLRAKGFTQKLIDEENRKPETARMANIEMNIYRLKVLRHLSEQRKKGEVTKVSFSIPANARNLTYTDQAQTLPDFILNMQKRGFTFEMDGGNIKVTRDEKKEGQSKLHFYITVNTPERSQIRIQFDGGRLNADSKAYINSLIKDLDADPDNLTVAPGFEFLDQLAQEIVKAREIPTKVLRDKAVDAAVTKLQTAYINHPLVQFFENNGGIFLKEMNESSEFRNFASKFLTVADDEHGHSYLRSRGRTYQYRMHMLVNFFTELQKYIKDDGRVLIDPNRQGFKMFKSAYSAKGIINHENIVTMVKDINEPEIHTERISDIVVPPASIESFMRRGVHQQDDVHLASIHTVTDEIRRLVGERYTDNEHLYLKPMSEMDAMFDVKAWGAMKAAVIYLTTMGNGDTANWFAGRHEAFHFTLRNLMKEETEIRVLDAIKTRMVEKGLAKSVDEISNMDAHEYGADLFMRKEHEKRTFLGRAMDALRGVLDRIGLHMADIDYWMREIDNESFAGGDIVRDPNDNTLFLMNAKWQWAGNENVELLNETFGLSQYWTELAHTRITPELVKHAPWSRQFAKFTFEYEIDDPDTQDMYYYKKEKEDTRSMLIETQAAFFSLNNEASKEARREIEAATVDISQTIWHGENDSTTEVTHIALPVTQMTANEYMIALDPENDSPENQDAVRKYQDYQLSKPEILNPLLQYIYKDQALETVIRGIEDPKVFSKGSYSQDRDTIFPHESVSKMLQFIVGTMPYWSFKQKKILTNAHGEPRLVRFSIIEKVLKQVVLNLQEKGGGTSDMDFINEIKKVLLQYSGKDSERVDAAYSFLMEWGMNPELDDVTYEREDGLYLDKNGAPALGRWQFLYQRSDLINATGAPVAMFRNMPADSDRELFEESYNRKAEIYGNIFSAIKTYYMSRGQRKQAELHTYYAWEGTWLEAYYRTNNEGTMFLGDVRGLVNDMVYTADVEDVNKLMIDKILPGEKQVYHIDTRNNKLWRKMKDGRFVLAVAGNRENDGNIGTSAGMMKALNFIGVNGITIQVLAEIRAGLRNWTQEQIMGIFKVIKLGAYLSQLREVAKKEDFKEDISILEYLKKQDTDVARETLFLIEEISLFFDPKYDGERKPGGTFQEYEAKPLAGIRNGTMKKLADGLTIPRVMDMYKFFESLADPFNYSTAITSNGIVRGVNGKVKPMDPFHNALTKAFPGKTDFNSPIVKNTEKKVNNILAGLPKDASFHKSAIFTINKYVDDQTSRIVYNDPLMNKYLSWDNLYVLDGVMGYRDSKEYIEMSTKDKLRGILEAITWADEIVEKDAPGVAALTDTFADKKWKGLTVLNFVDKQGKKLPFFKTIEDDYGKTRETRINKEALGLVLGDFKRYYVELKRVTQDKFEAAKKKKNGFFPLTKTRDYIVGPKGEMLPGRAITQPNNPYNKMTLVPDGDVGTIYEEAKLAHQELYDALVDIMKENDYELPWHIAAQWGAYVINGKSLSEWRTEAQMKATGKNEDGSFDEPNTYALKDYETLVKLAAEQMAADNYKMTNPDGSIEWHPVIEGAYWGHHIFNETISHHSRGSQFEYESLIDYVKRGSGITIDGLNYNTDPITGIDQYSRVMLTADIFGDHPYFGKFKKKFDGTMLLSPWQAKRHVGSMGGVISAIGDGPQKNVLFQYDSVTMESLYAKMDHFPISGGDYYDSDIYKEIVHLMLGPTLTHMLQNKVEAVNLDPEHIEASNVDIQRGMDRFGNKVIIENGVPIKIVNKLMTDFDDAITEVDRILTEAEPEERARIRGEMIDWLGFESATKMGIRKVNDIFNAPAGGKSIMEHALAGTLTDAKGNPVTLSQYYNSSDEFTITVDNSNLRLQTLTAQSITASDKNYPTQIANIIGIMEGNSAYGKRIQEAIAGFVARAAFELDNMSEDEIRNLLAKKGESYMFERGSGGLLATLLPDPGMVPEVVRAKQAMELINYFNNYIKPDMTGNTYIQEGSIHVFNTVTDENGRKLVHRWKDLSLEQQIATQKDPKTYEKFELRSAQYVVDGTEFKPDGTPYSKEEIRIIASTNPEKVRYRPADIIIGFPYKSEFGLDNKSSLASVCSYRTSEGKFYSLYENWDDRWSMENYTEFFKGVFGEKSFDEIFAGFHPKVAKAIDRMMAKAEMVGSMDNIIQTASEYFFNINKSFDIFLTRIPTSNASSAAVGRIVAFQWDKQNSIVLNPMKNNFDGSDFDSDPLQVYFRSLSKKGYVSQNKESLDNFRNDMFDAFYGYYMDGVHNFDMITEPIDLQPMRDIRDNKKQKHLQLGSALPTMFETDEVNYTAKRMVGFMANIENFVGKLLHIPLEARQQMMNDGKLSKSLQLLVDSDQQKYIPAVIGFVANLINAATDSSKEGGLLADLNLDFSITNIVVGMLLSGTPDGNFTKQIFDQIVPKDINENTIKEDGTKYTPEEIRSFQAMVTIIDKLKKNTRNSSNVDAIRQSLFNSLTALMNSFKEAGNVEGFTMAQKFLEYSYIGQWVRNLGVIAGIQSKELDVKTPEFYTLRDKVEYVLGSSLPEFIKLSEKPESGNFNTRYGIGSQIKWLKDNVSDSLLKKKTGYDFEQSIRQVGNLPYIIANQPNLRAMVVAINSAMMAMDKIFVNEKFIAEDGKPILQSKLLKIMGKKGFEKQSHYEAYEFAVRQTLVGLHVADEYRDQVLTFTDTSGNVRTEHYDLQEGPDRHWFAIDFADYVTELKYRFPRNQFLQQVMSIYNKYNGLNQVNFKNSIHKTDEEKGDFRQAFRKLPRDVKQNFYAYQLLIYGFEIKQGSMFEMLDREIADQYSEWQNENINQDSMEFMADKLAEDILIKRHDAFVEKMTNVDDRPMFYKENNSQKFNQRVWMKVSKGEYIPVNNIYPAWLNSYGISTSNMTDQKSFQYLGGNELRELNQEGRVLVSRPSKTIVGKVVFEFNDDGSATSNDTRHIGLPGELVMAPDGQMAQIESYTYENKAGRTITPRNKVYITREFKGFRSSFGFATLRNASAVSEMFLGRMQTMMPGVEISLASEIEMKDQLAEFQADGSLLINEKMISPETSLHELAHPLILLLKEHNMPVFNRMVEEAQQFMRDNDAFRKLMQENYGGLPQQIFEMELVANMVGANTLQRMTVWLANHGVNDMRAITTFWQRVGGTIRDAWLFIRDAMMKPFGINQSFNGNTVKDLSNFLYDSWVNQRMTTRITMDELAILQKGMTLSSRFSANSITNNSGLMSELRNSKDVAEMTGEQKIATARKHILNNKGVAPSWFDSNEPSFFELDSLGTQQKLLNMFDTYLEKRVNYADNFVKFINEGKLHMAEAAKYFGKLDNGDPVLSEAVLETFLRQISYDPQSTYVMYRDLKDSAHKELYNPLLDMDNVVVAIKEVNSRKVISLFNISREPINGHDHNTIKGGLLEGLMSRQAGAVRGVTYRNNYQDIAALGMGLMTRHMIKNFKNVDVNDIAYLDVSYGNNATYMLDPVTNRRNIEALSAIPEFMDSLGSTELKDIFNYRGLRDADPDWEAMLLSEYQHSEVNPRRIGMQKYIENIHNLSTQEKIDVINYRLKSLLHDNTEKNIGAFHSSQLREIGLLVRALQDLHYIARMDGQMNEFNGPSTFEKQIFDGASIGNDYIQFARKVSLDTSRMVVAQMNDIKKDINPSFEHFTQYAGTEMYLKDSSETMFSRIMATVSVEENGQRVERPIGYLLWTRDSSKDNMFAQQAIARNLTDADLAASEKIVNAIHQQMIDNYFHSRTRKYQYNKDGSYYTIEQAEKDLMEKTAYRKGMIPVMHAGARELLSRGNTRASVIQRKFELGNVFELFQNIDQSGTKDDPADSMRNMFWWQFGEGSTYSKTDFGDAGRLESMLGLRREFDPNGKEIWTLVRDEKGRTVSDLVSNDIEMVTNYFLLTSKRTIEYENNVLPVLTGIKIFLTDLKANAKLTEEFRTDNVVDYVNLFTDVAIKNKRRELSGPGNINIDKMVAYTHSVIGPYFLTLNLSVGMISLISNGMFAHIEALSRTLVDASRKEGIKFYGSGDLLEASGKFFTDYNLIGQIMQEYQVMDMSEMAIAGARTRTVTHKEIVSNFYANWFNWSADMYARSVVAAAQMIHDGSYAAHYLKEDGTLAYDEKRDRRYWNENGTQSDEQKVLRENMYQMQMKDGLIKKDAALRYAYDFQTMGTLKFLSDKYVVGSFDNMVRSVIGAGTLGKAFTMFRTWFMSRVTNAVSDGYWLDGGGFYVATKDEDGKTIAKWQRIWVEGYSRTLIDFAKAISQGRGRAYWNNMNATQAENLTKLALNLALSIGGLVLYNALVQGFNAPEDERKKKPLPPYRVIRNIKYSLESLLVLPTAFEIFTSPFTAMNIMENLFMDPFGGWRFQIGQVPQVKMFEELYKGMEQLRLEAKEKADETREENAKNKK